MVFKYLLISDGSSDSTLIPIINFALNKRFTAHNFIGERADFYRVPNRPKTLRDRVLVGKDLYNPDIIFVHRDCEKSSIVNRHLEIDQALLDIDNLNFVKIIPLRMTEAWLMIEPMAIRLAVNNPNGSIKLTLPAINKLEGIVDPKQLLESLLRAASELRGRRLDSLNTRQAIHLVSDHIEDYSPLFSLNSFRNFWEQLDNLAL